VQLSCTYCSSSSRSRNSSGRSTCSSSNSSGSRSHICTRDHIDYAISIADSSTLRYCGAQGSDDIVHECTCHACVAHGHRPQQLHKCTYGVNAHRPTCRLFNKQCTTAIIISRTVILRNRRPVGDRAPTCRPTHANNVRPTTRASILCHNGHNRRRLVLFVLCPLSSAHSLLKLMMAAAA